MGKFIQDGTGVVVSVDDSKDDRFVSGWKSYDGESDEIDPDSPEAEAARIAAEAEAGK